MMPRLGYELSAAARFARTGSRSGGMMVRKQGDWLAAKVGDELVMMSAEKGNYIGLSEVGARIWELIETPQERRGGLRPRCSRNMMSRPRPAVPKSRAFLTSW